MTEIIEIELQVFQLKSHLIKTQRRVIATNDWERQRKCLRGRFGCQGIRRMRLL